MFHSPAPASPIPAFRPARGSGFGAMDERSQLSAAHRLLLATLAVLPACDGATPPGDALGCAQAVAVIATMVTETATFGQLAVGRRIQRPDGYRKVIHRILIKGGWHTQTPSG